MRIAFLLSSLKFGGAERVSLNLAHEMKRQGIEVVFLLMSNEGEFLAEAEVNFKVYNLNCNKTYKLPYKLLKYFIQNRPDALISSFLKLNLCACLLRLFYPGFKLILWEHAPPSKSNNSSKWLYAITASIAYKISTKIVAVSSGVFKDIDRITWGLRHKMLVIFNPIAAPSKHLLLGLEHQGQKQLIWVGRLDDQKNPGLMLEAFALVSTACNARLVFVGDGPLRAELEQSSQELCLSNRVSFLGYLTDPYDVMLDSDLLVLTSDVEGFGNVIVEAMHCGLRVVTTDCGEGVHDILLEDTYGTIVPLKDPISLAFAIENELLRPHNAQHQINGAQRFLPKVITQQFLLAMFGHK